MTLYLDRFAEYFRAVHGHAPFAWQSRLLHEVVETGWPEAIAAPTGAGKTAVLDIAVFHLALQACSAPNRGAPVRIVFAVDRRVIVDQAHERAISIRDALTNPQHSILAEVAATLSRLSDGEPLHVEVLRGGLPLEDDWARTPMQPTILCTTVDQLGSRLLFRGYGVSERMAPVHAGLLGEDALLILDEVHLSSAFLDTLAGVGRHRMPNHDTDAPLPWAWTALSATPRPARSSFRLSAEETGERPLFDRLTACKPAELKKVDASAGSPDHVAAIVEQGRALTCQCEWSAPVIAIVVNRVALARRALAAIGEAGEDAILLTGSVRPVERDALIRRDRGRLEGDPPAPPGSRTLFVVTTQCIEAGADFDFDALLTQIAPLDALRQRFGRLNRRGRRATAPSIVVAAKDEIAARAEDLIYGDRPRLTWQWLGGDKATVDFGADRMDNRIAHDPEGAESCCAAALDAPLLRPADIELLAMTSPRPHPDPCLPLFLHGRIKTSPDVGVVWRGDLPAEWFEINPAAGRMPHERAEAMREIVSLMPPRPGEALQVPVFAARAWVAGAGHAGATAAAGIDISDTGLDPEPPAATRLGTRRVLRWRGYGADTAALVGPDEIRSGDLLVVPAAHGGCDAFGWAPLSGSPVTDIADMAAMPYRRRRAVLRLHHALWPTDPETASWSEVAELLVDADPAAPKRFVTALQDLPNLPHAIREFLNSLQGAPVSLHLPYDTAETEAPTGAVLVAPRGLREAKPSPAATPAEAFTDGGDAGSFMADPRSLSEHRDLVETMARGYSVRAGLPERLVGSISFAAHHHDDGKLDPRFQLYLGTTPGAPPRAKGGRRPVAEDRAARAFSGLPERWRHEALSVQLAARELDPDDERSRACALAYRHAPRSRAPVLPPRRSLGGP